VVCARCTRWNLTPVEERWEALEACERLFRESRMRASTDNIGMARIPGGLDLVRVGKPAGREMAAWRHSGSFARRWRTRGLPVKVLAGLAAAVPIVNPMLGLGFVPMMAVAVGAGGAIGVVQKLIELPRRARVVSPAGHIATVKGKGLGSVVLARVDGGLGVRSLDRYGGDAVGGTGAVHALRSVMTARNYAGAPAYEVEREVALLDRFPDAGAFITKLVNAMEGSTLGSIPPDVSLALEMALYDDVERRAMEGELAALETEWRAAELIAAIADGLLVPADIWEGVERLKRSNRPDEKGTAAAPRAEDAP
jgi:hypothetical protein